ncbi:MAG: helix-turn-helix transcriptional regulator [Phycisphaerae bacterium]|nr:helix-turn-helix transcriptional regulator [Phycisphaerae bacterium]
MTSIHCLERQGLVASRWGASETGRRRKYYRLKEKGSKVLRVQQDQWRVVHSALAQLWGTKPCSI